MAFIPDKFQLRIKKEFNDTQNNMVVQAVAGSGKTTTLKMLMNDIPPSKDAIYVAFNKHIVDSLKATLPYRENITISTLNSFGARMLYRTLGKITLVENKYFLIALRLFKSKWQLKKENKWSYCYNISKIVDVMRFNFCFDDEEAIMASCNEYGITILADELAHALHVFEIGMENINQIDFLDQIFVPVVRKIKFIKFHYVFADECLPYYMPVLLADGTSKPIGEIVEQKLSLDVLCYNDKTKKQEVCRVKNWSRTFNNKKLFKIRVYYLSDKPKNKLDSTFIVCTYNHRIWVKDKGYVEAQYIEPGMYLQFETSAVKTQKYKITKQGCAAVRNTIKIKNETYTKEQRNRMKGGNKGRNWRDNPEKIGGNGRENVLQNSLFEALLGNWVKECVVATKTKLKSYPSNYKIDIANPDLKIAIELDGASHNSETARAKDLKKDEFLKSVGWQVIRISNRELIKNFDEYVALFNGLNKENFCSNGTDCPVDAIVESIEEAEIEKEKFVYDIEVEKCHNFYANGLLVHNCQDFSKLQHQFVKKLLMPASGRLIGVGDKNQSIYLFAGASSNSFDAFKNLLPNTVELPLSYCYRCGTAMVEKAKQFVPQIESPPGQHAGLITNCNITKVIMESHAVICRNTKPLVILCRDLIRQGKKATIKGREIGENLIILISKTRAVTIEQCLRKIMEYETELRLKLLKKGVYRPDQVKQMLQLVEKKEIIKILAEQVGTVDGLIKKVRQIFVEENKEGISLMTVHKSKGNEWDVVWFLNSFLIPSVYACTEDELIQEKNICYVAITRAKKKLIYIDMFETEEEEEQQLIEEDYE